MVEQGTITGWLEESRSGSDEAFAKLLTQIYDELRNLASLQLRKTGSVGTLQTTALANESVIRMIKTQSIRAQNRHQFFAFATELIHNALIDELRAQQALKRRPRVPASFYTFEVDGESIELDLFLLDEALQELSKHDPDGVLVIQQRFYAGKSIRNTAEAMGWTFAQTQSNWTYARSWLLERLDGKHQNGNQ